jgi:hypothetical protein
MASISAPMVASAPASSGVASPRGTNGSGTTEVPVSVPVGVPVSVVPVTVPVPVPVPVGSVPSSPATKLVDPVPHKMSVPGSQA